MAETKSSKSGRNKPKCLSYRNRAQGQQNQLRRLIRHAKRQHHLLDGKGFAPAKMGKDIARCWERLNAELSNVQIRQICAELKVTQV